MIICFPMFLNKRNQPIGKATIYNNHIMLTTNLRWIITIEASACQICFVECVIKRILSVIHYTICGAVCFQFTHFPCNDWKNIYTLSYYHHPIGSMNYYPLLRVRSWNNGTRCMSFYILMGVMTSQITGNPVVRSRICSGEEQSTIKGPRCRPFLGKPQNSHKMACNSEGVSR